MHAYSAAMKLLWGAAAAGLVLATIVGADAAPRQMSDSVCPGAIPAVHAIEALPDPPEPVRAVAALETAVDAFRYCFYSALSDGAIEPVAHYAQTRVAQFEIVLGRQYMAQQRWDDAHAAFIEASRLSEIVATWKAPTYGYIARAGRETVVVRNQGVNNRSQFSAAATEIAKAADVELAKLVPNGPARRQATAPVPSPTPSP
jgi:hypothetical protein